MGFELNVSSDGLKVLGEVGNRPSILDDSWDLTGLEALKDACDSTGLEVSCNSTLLLTAELIGTRVRQGLVGGSVVDLVGEPVGALTDRLRRS